MTLFDLSGRRALVVGIANDHSIAYGVARALRQAGADLAVTYLNARAEPHVRPLAEALGAGIVMPLDVADAEQEAALFGRIADQWGRLDVFVHSIAFAPRDDLHGRVVDTTAAGFGQAMDVSVHSFLRLARRAEPLMTEGGTCMTMSFYGAEKVVSTYNVMGPVKAALEATVRELATELGPKDITVNTLSPGTIATRAAGGLDHFDEMLQEAAARAPMRRLATIDDVGAAAVFLAGPGARNITGSTLHIDAGFHVTA
ncbi:enoyl-ACP reductase FabI [Prosthecomicrobium sp. N25]|uniref:enoyl-ACP reductase FabI n=1 Tax=Prosthecomicrobium sp. N25 TaxID=3129254 RepID=UPI0030783B54